MAALTGEEALQVSREESELLAEKGMRKTAAVDSAVTLLRNSLGMLCILQGEDAKDALPTAAAELNLSLERLSQQDYEAFLDHGESVRTLDFSRRNDDDDDRTADHVSAQEVEAAELEVLAAEAALAAARANRASKKRGRRETIEREIERLQAARDALESDAE